MRKKLKLLIVVPSLHPGGSERVIVHLVRNLNRDYFDITLVVLNKEGDLLADLPNDITILYFKFKRTVFSFFTLYSLIHRLRPQMVFTTLGQLNLLISVVKAVSLQRPFFLARESSIVSQRNVDDRHPTIFRFLLRTFYPRLDGFICQSFAMKDDLISFAGISPVKAHVINNPLDISQLTSCQPEEKWNKNGLAILSIGQLRREKGYDRLIRSLSKVASDYTYKIIGSGTQKPELVSMIADFNLSEKIQLMNSIAKPYGYLISADCLLLGSYYEGFPNVVIEAHALGVPVIAWASPGGHNEIIINGFNGWLIQSEEELASIIERRDYLKLDKRAIADEARAKYDMDKIIGMYQDVFLGFLNRS